MKTRKIVGAWVVIAMVAALCVSADAGIITPTNAVLSSTWNAAAPATRVIEASRLDENNQLIPNVVWFNAMYDATVGTYPAGTMGYYSSQHWIYVDLGAEYVLDEIRIWNYFDTNAAAVPLRSIKDFRLYTGTAGAVLPTGPQNYASFFPGQGWTLQVNGNGTVDPVLPQNAVATVPIDPTAVFTQASGDTARYVAVDFGGFLWNGTGGNNFGGLSMIQVTEVPEPATMALLGLGALAFLKRRRA